MSWGISPFSPEVRFPCLTPPILKESVVIIGVGDCIQTSLFFARWILYLNYFTCFPALVETLASCDGCRVSSNRATFPMLQSVLNKDLRLRTNSSQAPTGQSAALTLVKTETIGKGVLARYQICCPIWSMSMFCILHDYPRKLDFGTIDPITFILWPLVKTWD